jgi:hypothetical protein
MRGITLPGITLPKINARLQRHQKWRTCAGLVDVFRGASLTDHRKPDWGGPALGKDPRAVGLYRAVSKGRATEPPAASRHMRVTIPAAPHSTVGVRLEVSCVPPRAPHATNSD